MRLLQPGRMTITAGPYAEAVSTAEAKLQTRQASDITAEDSLFASLAQMARETVESDTGHVLVWQRRALVLDCWQHEIRLFACPVRSVDSITYTDRSGVTQTLATSVYKVRTDLFPATITLKDGQLWPDIKDESGVITVTFQSGWSVPFTANPDTDVLTFADYEPVDGETFRLSNSGGLLPTGLDSLTKYHVVNASGSTCQLSLTAGGAAVNVTAAGTGTHFLGVCPGWARQAMRLLIARHHADREGSLASAQCEESYRAMIRPGRYSFV